LFYYLIFQKKIKIKFNKFIKLKKEMQLIVITIFIFGIISNIEAETSSFDLMNSVNSLSSNLTSSLNDIINGYGEACSDHQQCHNNTFFRLKNYCCTEQSQCCNIITFVTHNEYSIILLFQYFFIRV
jgi:hypothetical protein